MPDKPTIIERITGKRYHDIELPAESEPDPRLKGKSVKERVEKIRPSIEALKKWKADNKRATEGN